ncbi:MAG: hypothetical protein J7L11_05165 [Thermoprotei archaeon]|nr:hypothetical protein [Thermoprotei archaeon]
MGRRHDAYYARCILDCAFMQVRALSALPFPCLDPPAVVTPLLRRLDLSDYKVRSFWRFAKKIASKSGEGRAWTIFKFRDLNFNILLKFKHGPVYKIDDAFVDRISCLRIPSRCVEIPHSNLLYVYLHGSLEGSVCMRINVVHMLSQLAEYEGLGCVMTIKSLVENLIEGNFDDKSFDDLLCVMRVLWRYRKVLREFLPHVPLSRKELIKYSPAMRHTLSSLRKEGFPAKRKQSIFQ